MLKVHKPINDNRKFLKNLDNDEFDPTKTIFEVKKEKISEIIATFQGIKDLDETPQAACILTCAYYTPSTYALQLINEYHSTKRVLLTYKKNGNDWKILANQDSIKLHEDFASFDLKTPGGFESHCKENLMEFLEFKKLSSMSLNTKANENLVSAYNFLGDRNSNHVEFSSTKRFQFFM